MIASRQSPHPALSAFVAELWHYDGYVPAHARERILPSGTFELERALLRHLFRPLEHHPAVCASMVALSRSSTGIRTRDLARRAGLSERRLIDVFRAEVGMTPKAFVRVKRFQHLLARLRELNAPEWPVLSLEYGYFDQSHLIHDFREFTGITPTSYLKRMRTLLAMGAQPKPGHLPFAD